LSVFLQKTKESHIKIKKLRTFFFCYWQKSRLLLRKRKLDRADVELRLERMIEALSDVQLSVIKFYGVDKRLSLLNDLNDEQKAMFDVLDLMLYKKLVCTKLH
jgi:hypothetical protein